MYLSYILLLCFISADIGILKNMNTICLELVFERSLNFHSELHGLLKLNVDTNVTILKGIKKDLASDHEVFNLWDCLCTYLPGAS